MWKSKTWRKAERKVDQAPVYIYEAGWCSPNSVCPWRTKLAGILEIARWSLMRWFPLLSGSHAVGWYAESSAFRDGSSSHDKRVAWAFICSLALLGSYWHFVEGFSYFPPPDIRNCVIGCTVNSITVIQWYGQNKVTPLQIIKLLYLYILNN